MYLIIFFTFVFQEEQFLICQLSHLTSMYKQNNSLHNVTKNTAVSVLHRLAGIYIILQCIAKKLILRQGIDVVFSNDGNNLSLHINGQELFAITQNNLHSAIKLLK